MGEVKVSIIIPVYNPGKLLMDCLDSVLNQTLNDIEILCIDDGSTDGSNAILREYCKKDTRIKLFTQKNLGAGAARNLGIKNALGEFIVFLDSDDWIENELCEKLYCQAKSLNVDLVLFNTIRHLENGKTRDLIHFDKNFNEDYTSFTFDYHYIKDKVLNGYFGVIWCKFYRTSFLKDKGILFTKHKMFNDVEFHIKTLLLAKSISYYPEILYHYMMVGQPSLQSSFTGTYDSMCFYDVMVGVKEFLTENDFMDEFKIEFLNYTFFYFKTKLNVMVLDYKEEYFSKIKLFLESLDVHPSDFEKLINVHIPFYIHVINAKNYSDFKLMQDNFNGEKIKLHNNLSSNSNDDDQKISLDFDNEYSVSNGVYINILENNLNKVVHDQNVLRDNLSKEMALKEDEINKLHASFIESKNFLDELKFLYSKSEDENKYYKNVNSDLIMENIELKKELDEIKSSKLWKLKNKFN